MITLYIIHSVQSLISIIVLLLLHLVQFVTPVPQGVGMQESRGGGGATTSLTTTMAHLRPMYNLLFAEKFPPTKGKIRINTYKA